MTRRALESILTKAASAGRSSRRHALLKSAFYAHEALPKGFRAYTTSLYPLNPTVAAQTSLSMPKAVRDGERAQALGVLETLGFRSVRAQDLAPRTPPKVPVTRLQPKAVEPAPAAADPRAALDRIGKDFLLSGRNLVTNPIDTMRRYFNRQPLKR